MNLPENNTKFCEIYCAHLTTEPHIFNLCNIFLLVSLQARRVLLKNEINCKIMAAKEEQRWKYYKYKCAPSCANRYK